VSHCPTCLLPSPICAIASKVTDGRCVLARGSRWERRVIPGYVVTLDAATTSWTEPSLFTATYAFRNLSAASLRDDAEPRDEAEPTWSVQLHVFLRQYRPVQPWDEEVKIEIPDPPREYRSGHRSGKSLLLAKEPTR
jgi:hypothetical protein